MPPARRLLLATAASAGAALAFGQAAFAVAPTAVDMTALEEELLGADFDSPSLDLLPVDGSVTLGFGDHDGISADDRHDRHQGVDIKARRGAPVVAPADGTVIAATGDFRENRRWGKVVVIDHGDGLITRYAHLHAYKVKSGDKVRAGDVIAEVGSTGASTGPHLHFEAIVEGEPVDPFNLFTVDLFRPAPEPAAPFDPVDARAPATPAVIAEFEQMAQLRALKAFEELGVLENLSALTFLENLAAPALPPTPPAPNVLADIKPVVEPIINQLVGLEVSANLNREINAGVSGMIPDAVSYRYAMQFTDAEDARRRFERERERDRSSQTSTVKILSAEQRKSAIKSIEEMRRKMAAEHKERGRALARLRQHHGERRHLDRDRKHAAADHYRQQREKEIEAHADRLKRQALIEQSRTLEIVQRNLEQAARENARQIAASRRELQRTAEQLKKYKLPQKDLERAERKIAEANASIAESARHSEEALREARAEINAQQAELNRLHEELAGR